MRTFSAVVLAAGFAAAFSVHAADKPARPSEVHGVKLVSICIDCAVVSDIHKETVKGKGSAKRPDDTASAAGDESGKNGKTSTVWSTTVIFRNGTSQTYQQRRNPGLQPGDVVTIEGGVPTKYVN